MKLEGKTLNTLLAVVLLLVGIYVALKLIKALGFVLIVIGVVWLGVRFLRR